ncbi:MAG: flippase-like domain-containing protein [Methanosarcinales archaeon]
MLPAYNEADRIKNAVQQSLNTLQSLTNSFEIIIAEDGSTDGTDRIARELASKYQRVLHLHSDTRQGRGKALNRAFKASSGKILIYIDVDLATDMKHLSELISAIREGYDFATGSRMLPQSQVKRSFKRGFASYGFNFLTRLFLRSKIHDHQAGFKAFKREPLFNLLDEVSDEHWFWDTELLVRAQKKGYSVKEFPVKWEHGGTSKVDLINDIIGMGSQIFRLWWELRASKILEKYNKNRKIVVSSIIAVVILFLISTFIGSEDIIKAAYTASLPLIIFSLGIYILSWPVRGIRYQQILKKLNYKEKLNFLIGTIFLSQTANVILPARIGDITRAYLLNKKDIPLTSGFSSLAVERVFDILAISINKRISFGW